MIALATAEANLARLQERRVSFVAAIEACRRSLQEAVTACEVQLIEFSHLLSDGDASIAALRLDIDQMRSAKSGDLRL